MIMHANAKPWTKAETARAKRMGEEIGCIFCGLNGDVGPCDCRHHIISGNKRMGHWFTLPCCEKHHADCHNGTFSHAVQIDRWLKVQHLLGLSDELPRSKIVPRREPAPTEIELLQAATKKAEALTWPHLSEAQRVTTENT